MYTFVIWLDFFSSQSVFFTGILQLLKFKFAHIKVYSLCWMVLSCDKCLMSCCWGRSSRGCDHLLPWELDPGNKRLLTPPLPLEYAFGLLFPLPEAAPRILPRDDNEVLRLPGWYMWLNSVKASVLTFKIWVGCRDLVAQDKSRQLPCLLKPPPATLERFISFLVISLPWVDGGWGSGFRRPLRLWTNTCSDSTE